MADKDTREIALGRAVEHHGHLDDAGKVVETAAKFAAFLEEDLTVEATIVEFSGVVVDAGGGHVTISVDRDTQTYPDTGLGVDVVRRAEDPAGERVEPDVVVQAMNNQRDERVTGTVGAINRALVRELAMHLPGLTAAHARGIAASAALRIRRDLEEF